MTTLWLTALLIVESSTLYALGVIAGLATFLGSYDGQYPEMDAIVLLAVSREPVVFTLVSVIDPRVYFRAL